MFDREYSTETKFWEKACKQTRPGAENHQPKAPLDPLDNLQLLEVINEMPAKAVGDLRTTYFIRLYPLCGIVPCPNCSEQTGQRRFAIREHIEIGIPKSTYSFGGMGSDQF